jgi:hypothetical protein
VNTDSVAVFNWGYRIGVTGGWVVRGRFIFVIFFLSAQKKVKRKRDFVSFEKKEKKSLPLPNTAFAPI